MLSKVFDKLATDPAMEGKGLGLTPVKQIVEAHGGTVSAEGRRDFPLPKASATVRQGFATHLFCGGDAGRTLADHPVKDNPAGQTPTREYLPP